MKRTIATLILTLSLSIPAFAANWWAITEDLKQSVYRLSMVADGEEVGMCSSFVIDQRVSNVLTAAHCAPEGIEVSLSAEPNVKGNVLLRDEVDDLAVIQYRGKVLGVALRPGKPVKTTDEVMSIGFPFGSNQPIFQIGRVAQRELFVDEADPRVMINPQTNGGMSGGPIVDITGKVVSINQLGRGSLGAGVGIDRIRKATAKFWQFDR